MKKLLEKILYIIAKGILKRQKPKVVGITGTMGKTSTKDAIYCVLSKKYKVRKNIKNYNNEIGVPLTIIGCESGNKNPIKWTYIFIKGILQTFLPWSYPEILILEMGADKPDDIEYLVELAPCYVGVITAIGEKVPVHVEFFNDISELVKEKIKIVEHLGKDNFAVLNADDKKIMQNANKIKSQVFTFGYDAKADITFSEVSNSLDSGIHFKVSYKGNVVPFNLDNIIGLSGIYAAGAAICVGKAFEMNLVDISESLKDYNAPPGRMNLIPGIKNTILLDDSYNSSPEACAKALEFLASLKGENKKYAVLGNMEELGEYTEEAHAEIGKLVNKLNIDYLITVGDKAEIIAEAAKKSGMREDYIFSYLESEKAGLKTQELTKQGDIVLIKGSQSVRCEKVTKELMAEPNKAGDLLVRQDKTWENK
ncbi:MAG: UDP-N-acetylmuramoyl-tripeptide--D-alanyl-D-alanine ligase [Patescibacteria group bacterium]